MALIEIDQFFGQRPAVHRYKLKPYEAQTAINTDLFLGAIYPLKGGTLIGNTTVVDPTTIFKHNNSWYEWALKDVDIVRSPVADDQYDRIYYTGDGDPKVASYAMATGGGLPYPSDSYRMGVPTPTVCAASLNGTGSGTAETRYYVVTYVDTFGAEGPPSPTSSKLTWTPGQTVDVTIPAAPVGDYNITKVRIYRTNTAGTTALFQFVAEVNVGSGTYNDSKANDELGEELPSADWDMPPNDMKGLVSMPGGFLAGFQGNEILFSEPGLPHAWPASYRLSVDSAIIGFAVIGSSLIVLTAAMPYVAVGSHPASVTLTRLDIGQACVSKKGIVDFGGMVVYPSAEGLVGIDPNGSAKLLTELVIDRSIWQNYGPTSMRAYRWKGLYMAFMQNIAFLFNPMSPESGIVQLQGAVPSVGYFDIYDNKTYLVFGNQLVDWGEGAIWPYTWKSRPFPMQNPESANVVQVFADNYPVEVTVYRDQVLQAKVEVANDSPHRIPNGERGREYEIEVQGTGGLYKMFLSTTMNELKGV
jgi:hypothetical protein